MKERPIIFSAQSVRAILAGRKTMARRVVKPQPYPNGYRFDGREILCHIDDLPANAMLLDVGSCCGPLQSTSRGTRSWDEPVCHLADSQFVVGRRLWVREKWRIGAWDEDRGAVAIDYFDGPRREWIDVPDPTLDGELFNRLWQQSTDDARAAGLTPDDDGRYRWAPGESPCRWRPSIHMPRWASRITLEIESVRVERLQDISEADAMAEGCQCYVCGAPLDGNSEADCHCFHRTATASDYRDLWEHINGEESWAANPWVWVLAFKRVTPP